MSPEASDPEALFADTPIDVVASYVPSTRGAQFVENPTANLSSAFGWSVWYAPQRDEAFLATLYAIYGGKPYLVHATTNATWSVEGHFASDSAKWIPDAYNLVGYSLKSPEEPTFEQFFRSSPAHDHNKIYRLQNGVWQQVLQPASTSMRSGEAFWIYSDGHSDYPGPLDAEWLDDETLNQSEFLVGLRLSVPFGDIGEHVSSKSSIATRMNEMVQRDFRIRTINTGPVLQGPILTKTTVQATRRSETPVAVAVAVVMEKAAAPICFLNGDGDVVCL